MTKREREAMVRKLEKLEAGIGKKRDELRGMTDDFRQLIDSVDEADEQLASALSDLQAAKRSFEDATDSLSQYV